MLVVCLLFSSFVSSVGLLSRQPKLNGSQNSSIGLSVVNSSVGKTFDQIVPPTEECSVQIKCESRRDKCTCAPNLFVIGSMRVASTSFFLDMKRAIPQADVGDDTTFVGFPTKLMQSKQKSYFDYAYCAPPNVPAREALMNDYLNLWHKGQKKDKCEKGLRADFSVTYMQDLLVAGRMRAFYQSTDVNPHFFVLLRNPTKRYLSEVRHWNATDSLNPVGLPANVKPRTLNFEQYARLQIKHFNACLPEPSLIKGTFKQTIKSCIGSGHVAGLANGLYAPLLQFWTAEFDTKQFTVISFASYLKRTGPTLQAVVSRLGGNTQFPQDMKPSDYEVDHLPGEKALIKIKPDPAVMTELDQFYAPWNQQLVNFLQDNEKRGLQVVGGANAIFEA